MLPGIRTSPEQLLVAVSHLRRSPPSVDPTRDRKEWFHFCVFGPGLDLLVNFSFSDRIGPFDGEAPELARLTVLARDTAWDGDVETFTADTVHAPAGRIDLTFGPNRLRFADGVFTLRIQLRDRPIAANLLLRPLTYPVRAPNVPLPDGPPLHWAIVPRLEAHGTVTLDTRTYVLDGTLAYHDHNWSRFCWGADFAWRWGFALPESSSRPWSLAFAFVSDRARTRALSQGLFLWHGARLARTFRDDAVQFDASLGLLQPQRVVKIPRVMALLAPEIPTDVPRHVTVHARDGEDRLSLRFTADDLVQVVIPNDSDLGVTIINEVTGAAHIEGTIGGERFDAPCRSVFEFLGR